MTNNSNNLRIDGLLEVDAETTEQTAVAVSSKLREKLRISEPPLESAHRVRPRLEGRPRPVIAKFTRPGCCAEAREDAPRNKNLPQRGSGPASRKMKTDPLSAVAAARANGKIALLCQCQTDNQRKIERSRCPQKYRYVCRNTTTRGILPRRTPGH